MGMPFILHYDEIPSQDCIRCRNCRTRVAFVDDYIGGPNIQFFRTGFFSKMFNVEVQDNERYHVQVSDCTIAYTYCVQCRTRLGCKFIAVPRPSVYVTEGRFLMILHKLIDWNDQTLLHLNEEQVGGANEQNVDANEQNAYQNGYANEQNGHANEQNAYQNGDANEQNHDQDGGAPMN